MTKLSKEIKVFMIPNSAKTVAWEEGITVRQSITKAGFSAGDIENGKLMGYTTIANGKINLEIDELVPEPNGSSVTLLMVTKEIKGNK